ncbi:hypothetical protein FQR65_LT17103 [Abscondita terminalis]|nr:hypothetical protein FQR65_LT17103 [Abscondita terminalis]
MEQQHWQYADWLNYTILIWKQIRKVNFVADETFVAFIQDALTLYSTKRILGVMLGKPLSGQISIGILGFAMQACKTVAEALETALQYHPISGSVLDLSVHLSQDYCEIELIERSDCGPLKAFFCDEVFASIMTCLNMMLDRDYELDSLELSYDHSAYHKIINHLKQQVLEKKAKQWLEDNQSISQISFNLGFSELREFRRAFKKWTGFSPTWTLEQIETELNMVSAYDELPRTPANFVALSPLRYLERAAYIYPDQDAIVHGQRHISWRETYQRCRQFAHQLRNLGIEKNDTVSVLLPNIPAMIEAHFAVPMAGAVLNTLNTRLDAKTIAFMLEHAETKVLLVDPEFATLAQEAVGMLSQNIYIIDVADVEYDKNDSTSRIGQIEYEQWLQGGDTDFEWHLPQDEWDAISLNYTSGTTVMVAGAAPPAAIIEGMHHIGVQVNHVYGLTETYGPSALCASQAGWSNLSIQEQAQLHSRQGVPYPLQDGMRVLDAETMQPVPNDGKTMGEIMFRGNIVMKGYLKNTQATEEAFKGGWFHTGDLAVCQPDGYAKIMDRSKDIIISGGENISSLEVEEILYTHPAIMTAAVVAQT